MNQLWSYWETDNWFSNIDLLVVGSGITGLNAAIHFKKLHPRAKILVVERGMLPYGASTRNAGFACFGSLSELLDDFANMPSQEVYDLVSQRYQGLEMLRSMHGDAVISYDECGGYELFTEEQSNLFEACASKMQEINREMAEITGLENTYIHKDKEIDSLGFKGVKYLIFNQAEGAIDTGRMMHNLLKMAYASDIRIINNAEVTEWTEDTTRLHVSINKNIAIKAKRMLIAANGFANKLMQIDDLQAGRTQVLITTPIENLKVKGCFHYEAGYVYFRNVGNRILLGGGRHLDKQSEATTDMSTTAFMQNYLEHLLSEVIIPGQAFQIEQRWAGILGLGKHKKPIIKPYSAKVFCAVRLGGMGVAIGTKTGRDAAEMITFS
jgi:glycine/D-amino acid oxidase-like deaminating enzyme